MKIIDKSNDSLQAEAFVSKQNQNQKSQSSQISMRLISSQCSKKIKIFAIIFIVFGMFIIAISLSPHLLSNTQDDFIKRHPINFMPRKQPSEKYQGSAKVSAEEQHQNNIKLIAYDQAVQNKNKIDDNILQQSFYSSKIDTQKTFINRFRTPTYQVKEPHFPGYNYDKTQTLMHPSPGTTRKPIQKNAMISPITNKTQLKSNILNRPFLNPQIRVPFANDKADIQKYVRPLYLKQNKYPQYFQSRSQKDFSNELNSDMQKANISQTSMKIALEYYDLRYHRPSTDLIAKQVAYLQQKYNISEIKEELPFCVVMLGYNNIEYNRYKLAITSIINQNYKNYHVILIDDFSIDGYAQKAQQFINQNAEYPQKFKVIRTTQNNKPMRNHYIASQQYCEQHELIIIVDGDDGLIGTQVFKLFNHQFQKKDVWFAWGNYYATGSDKIGMSGYIKPEIITRNSYRREGDWVTSHPKVFYNKLFRSVKKADLSYKKQEFLPAVADRAIVYPIVQMAIEHLLYIPEILYLYVDLTSQAEQFKFRQENRRIVEFLKGKPSYQKLQCLFTDQNNKCIQASQYSLSKSKQY